MYFFFIILTFGIISESSIASDAPVKKRTIDAQTSTINQFAYLVAIKLHDNFCSGAILGPKHVITASGCLTQGTQPSTVYVRAGSSFSYKNGTILQARNITRRNNLAILELGESLSLDYVTREPIPIIESSESTKVGVQAVTPGWTGSLVTNDKQEGHLQTVKVKIVDGSKCKNADGGICVQADTVETEEQKPCGGYGGSPLVVDGKLAGIAPEGANCMTLVNPTVFTEVQSLKKWIEDTKAGGSKDEDDDCIILEQE